MAKKKKKPQAGIDFMRKTQFKSLDPSGQAQGVPPPHPELPWTGDTLALPDPKTLTVTPIDLRTAIDARKSERVFLDDPLTINDLSFLLWTTQGVKEIDQIETFRTVPSAGARHAFETYLVINRVTDLTPGLYRYLALSHQLGIVNTSPGIADHIATACLQPDLVQTSAVTFIWTAVAQRMTWRYSDRAYRYLHLDAGHVGQNLYLAVQSVNCRTCTSAAFNDDELNKALHIDGVDHFAVYFGAVGR